MFAVEYPAMLKAGTNSEIRGIKSKAIEADVPRCKVYGIIPSFCGRNAPEIPVMPAKAIRDHLLLKNKVTDKMAAMHPIIPDVVLYPKQ